MNNQGYVCLGSCHALISEEQHKNGLTACGSDSCEYKAKPFVKGFKCAKCGTTYTEGGNHKC